MLSEITVLILDIIGTVSFAVSGAIVSIKAKLDLFGVVFLGVITAVGGGILRDLIIGVIPPAVFSRPLIVLVAVLTSLVVFTVCYIKKSKISDLEEKITCINNYFDAIGLGAFTVMGTEVAFLNNLSHNMFLTVTLGFLTAVGGGVIRDVLANTAPYIFTKHIYALVAIGGAIIYYFLRIQGISVVLASSVVIAFVFVLRMFSTRYLWKLPKI